MNSHDVVHKLKYVSEQLRQAREISICPKVIDHINEAQNKIWNISDSLVPELVKNKKEDV